MHHEELLMCKIIETILEHEAEYGRVPNANLRHYVDILYCHKIGAVNSKGFANTGEIQYKIGYSDDIKELANLNESDTYDEHRNKIKAMKSSQRFGDEGKTREHNPPLKVFGEMLKSANSKKMLKTVSLIRDFVYNNIEMCVISGSEDKRLRELGLSSQGENRYTQAKIKINEVKI